jgi:hypothetical protein
MQITWLFDAERHMDAGMRRKNRIKRAMQRSGMWSTRWIEPPPRSTVEADRHAALRQLEQAANLRGAPT